MTTRVATGARSAWLAGLLATALAVPALAASETTADRLLNAGAEPQNWLTHHKDYAATRHSTLDQITKDNVKDLKVAWTYALGGIEGGGIWPHGGLEGTPIVEDGFMYVTDGWGAVYKLDVTQGPGKLVWKMDPGTDKDWSGAVSCCGVNNRGVALWRDKVISHTLDGRLLATDKETGEVAWERQVADPAIAEVITVAPLVVKDLAITGVSGAEYGIRGWIAATDLNTGKEVWRRHTIPGPGEPGTRHLGGQPRRLEDRRRLDLGDGLLRSGDRPDHLGGRQPRARLGRRIPSGRQPVHQQHDRGRPGRRRDQVALSVHAERPLRLRRRGRERPGRRRGRGSGEEARPARRSQRLRLRDRPDQRRVRLGHPVRQGADLDPRPRQGHWPAARLRSEQQGPTLRRRHGAVARQPARHLLPRQHGRQELAADRVPSRVADLVHSR